MNVITTPSLNQNNVLTTKYFRSETVYANYIKTTDGKIIDVSSITNNTDFSNLSNEVNLINLDLTNIHTSIQNNTSDISTINTQLSEITTQLNNLSIDFQTDIYLPLYQSSNEITKMTSLCDFIYDNINDILPVTKKFESAIYLNTDLTNIYDLKVKDIHRRDSSTVSIDTLNATIARVTLIEKETGNESFDGCSFNMAFNFDSSFALNYRTSLSTLFFPKKIYNSYNKKWYYINEMKDSISYCDTGSLVKRYLYIHIPKCFITTSKVFYKLFDPSMMSGKVQLILHKVRMNYYKPSTFITDNTGFYRIYMPFNANIMKWCDLYATGGIYLCPQEGEYLNFSKITSANIPPHVCTIVLPPFSHMSFSMNGLPTNLSWCSGYIEDTNLATFKPFYLKN